VLAWIRNPAPLNSWRLVSLEFKDEAHLAMRFIGPFVPQSRADVFRDGQSNFLGETT
jgi:hypothetical protein